MDKAHIVQLFVCLFVIPFMVIPTIGGGGLALGFRAARLPAVRFFRYWKVYLASCCYGFLFLIPTGFLLRNSTLSTGAQQIIQLSVFFATQLILLPILLRSFTWKSLGVTAVVVTLTNAAGYALFVLQQP